MAPVKNILIVEDSDDDAFLMKRALSRSNITSATHRVASGRAAIDYLSGAGNFADRTQFPLPDFLFLDIKMPGTHSGFAVLRWIGENLKCPPPVVCMLSSSDQPQDVAQAEALGAHHFAVKPPKQNLFEELQRKFGVEWPHG